MYTITKKELKNRIEIIKSSKTEKLSSLDQLKRFEKALNRGPISGNRYAIFNDERDFR